MAPAAVVNWFAKTIRELQGDVLRLKACCQSHHSEKGRSGTPISISDALLLPEKGKEKVDFELKPKPGKKQVHFSLPVTLRFPEGPQSYQADLARKQLREPCSAPSLLPPASSPPTEDEPVSHSMVELPPMNECSPRQAEVLGAEVVPCAGDDPPRSVVPQWMPELSGMVDELTKSATSLLRQTVSWDPGPGVNIYSPFNLKADVRATLVMHLRATLRANLACKTHMTFDAYEELKFEAGSLLGAIEDVRHVMGRP